MIRIMFFVFVLAVSLSISRVAQSEEAPCQNNSRCKFNVQVFYASSSEKAILSVKVTDKADKAIKGMKLVIHTYREEKKKSSPLSFRKKKTEIITLSSVGCDGKDSVVALNDGYTDNNGEAIFFLKSTVTGYIFLSIYDFETDYDYLGGKRLRVFMVDNKSIDPLDLTISNPSDSEKEQYDNQQQESLPVPSRGFEPDGPDSNDINIFESDKS
ncbi:MAG: hypothetical protein PHU42_02510 [Patescibacteria group bacterium]|nr:hypothetical protein [Patescibacteria group bacterium]